MALFPNVTRGCRQGPKNKVFSQFSRDFNEKCLTSVADCCVYWWNELLLPTFMPLRVAVNYRNTFRDLSPGASSAPSNIQYLEKWGYFGIGRSRFRNTRDGDCGATAPSTRYGCARG
jgi:hypothetical protein